MRVVSTLKFLCIYLVLSAVRFKVRGKNEGQKQR